MNNCSIVQSLNYKILYRRCPTADGKNTYDKLDEVRKNLPPEDVLYDVADLFKMFGDSTRTKIMNCLSHANLRVSEIAELLGMSDSSVSHKLRVLRSAKLVKRIKSGNVIMYSLDDYHVVKIMEYGLSHVSEADGEED